MREEESSSVLDHYISLQAHAQKEWIAAHGGDLLGYRQYYTDAGMFPRYSADDIYYADLNYLRKLEGVPQDVIDRDNATRVLGEEYFV